MPFCRQTCPSCPAVKAIFSPLWSSHTHTKWRNTQAQQITDDGTNKTTFRSFLKKNDRLCVNLFLKSFSLRRISLWIIYDHQPFPRVCVCAGPKEKRGAQHHEYLLVLGVPRNNINKWEEEEEAGRIFWSSIFTRGGKAAHHLKHFVSKFFLSWLCPVVRTKLERPNNNKTVGLSLV